MQVGYEGSMAVLSGDDSRWATKSLMGGGFISLGMGRGGVTAARGRRARR
jgi:hypothetical protein